MLVPSLQTALLMLASFSAGLVDAIGGGGGIITVPALLAAGLEPHAVLATNKGQACLGALVSLATFAGRGGVDRERLPLGLATGFAGSLAGAALVLLIPPAPLRPVVLALLIVAGLVLLFRDRLSRPGLGRRGSSLELAALGLGTGAYDGFFGPGTGTLLIIGFLHFFKDTPTRASGNAKIINFGSNFAALLLFQYHHAILWKTALPMGIANMLGANLGVRVALRHGDRVVRGVVFVVLTLVSFKVAWDVLS